MSGADTSVSVSPRWLVVVEWFGLLLLLVCELVTTFTAAAAAKLAAETTTLLSFCVCVFRSRFH